MAPAAQSSRLGLDRRESVHHKVQRSPKHVWRQARLLAHRISSLVQAVPSRMKTTGFVVAVLLWAVYLVYNSLIAAVPTPDVRSTEGALDHINVRAFKRAAHHWGFSGGDQQRSLAHLLTQFDTLARYFNLTYMLHDVTALGAYRHHGVTPWDHRLVILMEWTSIADLRKLLDGSRLLLERREPDHEHPRRPFWIIFLNEYESGFHPKDWITHIMPWPYLEVHRFLLNDSAVVDTDSPGFRHPARLLLPPVFLPFEGLMLPAYRCFDDLVPGLFHTEACCLPEAYTNELESNANGNILTGAVTPSDTELVTCMSCQALKGHFPFVRQRMRLSPLLVYEEVRVGESIVAESTIYRPECRDKPTFEN